MMIIYDLLSLSYEEFGLRNKAGKDLTNSKSSDRLELDLDKLVAEAAMIYEVRNISNPEKLKGLRLEYYLQAPLACSRGKGSKFSKKLEKKLSQDTYKYGQFREEHLELLKMLWYDDLSVTDKSKVIKAIRKYVKDVYPFTKIPNVSEFKIVKLAPYQPILLQNGIKQRMGNPEMEKTPGRNKRYNRYLEFKFKLLHEYRDNPKKFWREAEILLNHSVAFRLSLLFKIFSHWYKDKELKYVVDLLKEYNKIYNN